MPEERTIHFIGIKGVGMASLALIAKEKGYQVTGSDVAGSFITDSLLEKANVPVFGFSPENLAKELEFVVYSAAFDESNIEIKEAEKRKLKLLPYSEALAFFAKPSKIIAISGIHGKTTTTAMISYLLTQNSLDPSYLIGAGSVGTLGQTAHVGQGEYFVLEADEYKKTVKDNTSKFLDLNPQIEIITSIEMDHPDIFVSLDDVYQAFYKFACRIPRSGFIVINTDYPKCRKIVSSLADRNFETYGTNTSALWRITGLNQGDKSTFFIEHDNDKYGPFILSLPGEGNVLNAAAAAITTFKLGMKMEDVIESLKGFKGVGRRFEIKKESSDLIIIDDYAHHPHALEMTLQAARSKYPNRQIWCIFQPHTYSRTKKLIDEFAKVFNNADRVIITPIYASEREKEVTIKAQDLVDKIKTYHQHVKYMADFSDIIEEIKTKAQKGAVVLTIGAGDIYKLSEELAKGN